MNYYYLFHSRSLSVNVFSKECEITNLKELKTQLEVKVAAEVTDLKSQLSSLEEQHQKETTEWQEMLHRY